MILALLLALTWDTPHPSVDVVEATAFIRAPVVMPCPDPEAGDCIVAYLETWRSVLTLPATATRADWAAPDLPSRAVAYMTVRNGRTIDDGAVCWSGGVRG